MSRSGILIGALCGALVTAAHIASLFLAYVLAGLPFVPFPDLRSRGTNTTGLGDQVRDGHDGRRDLRAADRRNQLRSEDG